MLIFIAAFLLATFEAGAGWWVGWVFMSILTGIINLLK